MDLKSSEAILWINDNLQLSLRQIFTFNPFMKWWRPNGSFSFGLIRSPDNTPHSRRGRVKKVKLETSTQINMRLSRRNLAPCLPQGFPGTFKRAAISRSGKNASQENRPLEIPLTEKRFFQASSENVNSPQKAGRDTINAPRIRSV